MARLYPRAALAVLTGLNFVNYVDRSVLFAVQPLIQQEFHRTDAEFGFLTTAFFICYMVTAPLIGPLADRYTRRNIMIAGALVWSAATLLTALTYDFETLLVRHAVVGIGEATFVTIAPSFLADLYSEGRRGRVLAIFSVMLGLGTAVGYMMGGYLGHLYGWRVPFYVAAGPGFLLALALMFIPEPPRGTKDTLSETRERGTVLGLAGNGAFWTASLGMAMITFALGGASVWMPTFLSRTRGIPLDRANLIFGAITGANAIVATLTGGWLGDRLLRRHHAGYYLLSAISLMVGAPLMLLALYSHGAMLFPAIFLAEFFLFLNTGPLNAAVVNSVAARIRATALAVNLFTIHLLGDALSPVLIGKISDRSSLQTGLAIVVVAVLLGCAVLFYGARFAPHVRLEAREQPV
jgi:MFS family permease